MAGKAKEPAGRNVYVPIEGFVADIDGSPVNFRGDGTGDGTRVSAAWLDEHPQIRHLFQPIRVQYDVEQATAAPGETRAGLPADYES